MKLLSAAALAGIAVFLISCETVDPVIKYPNMVADLDPISLGTIEAQFDRLFSSKLNKSEVEVIFYPRLNAVALEFRYEFIVYRQFWDQTGRKQLTGALDLYKTDFAARSLTTRYNKSRAVYGRVKGQLEWVTFRYAKIRSSLPVIELGYRFRSDSPFFATYMRSARELPDLADEAPPRNDSLQITMYFTRAQADELIKFFDQSFLLGLIGETKSTDLVDDADFYGGFED